MPGAVALVQHRGRTVLHEAVGLQRPANPAQPGLAVRAMAPDTVFRIYSMTKPIASLVALMLMEEGRLLLAHPVSRYLPAFQGQQVYDPATGTLAPAAREATLHDLLRHTAGLSYAWDTGPIADQYRNARVGSRRHSNQQLAAALAPLPLLHPPGTCWGIQPRTDVLGAIIEVIEGAPLGQVLQRRVFEPLGMQDTGFSVPASSRHRLAEPFARDPLTGAGVTLIDVAEPPVFESAGGGLVSTAADYARFLQLMLGRGTVHTPHRQRAPGQQRHGGIHDGRPPRHPAARGHHPAPRLRFWPGCGGAPGYGRRHAARQCGALQLERHGLHVLLRRSGARPVRHPAHAGAGGSWKCCASCSPLWSTPRCKPGRACPCCCAGELAKAPAAHPVAPGARPGAS